MTDQAELADQDELTDQAEALDQDELTDQVELTDQADQSDGSSLSDLASQPYIAYLCQPYCDNYEKCVGDTLPEDCMAVCAAQANTDEVFLKKLMCTISVKQSNWCSSLTAPPCQEPFEDHPYCPQHCDKIQACQALGTDMFGFEYKDCILKCGALKSLGVQADTMLACIANALDTCSGVELQACFAGLDNPCIYSMCDVGFAADCGLVPEYFLTLGDCKAVCQDWSLGQIIGWSACSELGTAMGLACGQRVHDCMQVPAQPYEGLADFCGHYFQLCPPEGNYLGLLTDEECAWETSGLLSLTGESFDPAAAQACLSSWSSCYEPMVGAGPGSTLPTALTCAVPLSQAALDACQQWVDECTAPDPNIEGLMHCRSVLVYNLIQGTMGGVVDCLVQAEDCDTKGACLNL